MYSTERADVAVHWVHWADLWVLIWLGDLDRHQVRAPPPTELQRPSPGGMVQSRKLGSGGSPHVFPLGALQKADNTGFKLEVQIFFFF